jgi:hypothetical protein
LGKPFSLCLCQSLSLRQCTAIFHTLGSAGGCYRRGGRGPESHSEPPLCWRSSASRTESQ